MKSYNSLFTDLDCPHCHETVDVEIELLFGDVGQYTYVLGDTYKWLPDKPVHSGGRPEDGNIDGEGSEVCPQCGSVFTVTVEIRNDIIAQIVHRFTVKDERDGKIPMPDIRRCMPMPEPHQGVIKSGDQWQLTHRREAALLRLAELGVDIYSVGGDDYTLMIPHGLPADHYTDIGYLIAQLGDEDFPAGYEGLTIKGTPSKIYQKRIEGHPPVYFVDGYPQGLKYRVQPSKE
jgi:hypothetical protein